MRVTRSHLAIGVISSALVTFIGCSNPPERAVSGQIFIVTNSGENVRMGLVLVRAIDSNAFEQHLENRFADWLPRYRALENRVRTLALDHERSAARHAQLLRDRKLAHDAFISGLNDDYEGRSGRWERYVTIGEEIPNAARRTAQASRRAQMAGDSLATMFNGEFFVLGLPPALDSTKTDANGEFHLTFRSKKDVVLAAAAQRTVPFGSRESYYWLIMARAENNQRILISNDNRVGSEAPECALKGSDLVARTEPRNAGDVR